MLPLQVSRSRLNLSKRSNRVSRRFRIEPICVGLWRGCFRRPDRKGDFSDSTRQQSGVLFWTTRTLAREYIVIIRHGVMSAPELTISSN